MTTTKDHETLDRVLGEATERHPLAIAWDKWLASLVGKDAANPYNCPPTLTRVYLENRLHRAFDAGAKAAYSPEREAAFEALREVAQAVHDDCSVLKPDGKVLQRGPMMEPSEGNLLALREALALTDKAMEGK